MELQVNIATAWQGVVVRAFWLNRVLLGLAVLHFLAAFAVSRFLGQPFYSAMVPLLLTLFKSMVPVFILMLGIGRLTWIATVIRPAYPLRRLFTDIKSILLDAERLLSGIIALVIIGFVVGTASFLKDMIPLIRPFSWDPAFAQLDRVLHGGQDVWRLLAPVLATPFVTSALNAAYHAWLPILYFLVFIAAFGRTDAPGHRMFLLSMVMAWIVAANLLATTFSSVGPVYYAAFGFGDTFKQQMQMLHSLNEISPVWALRVQDMLLDGYQTGGSVRGISAMPSMHVTTATLMAFYGFTLSRPVGWALTAFAVTIFLGSVHLAWHYAVDGYLAIALAAIFWRLSRRLVIRDTA
ncbi:PAP2 superfamily protein [Roseovarius pacificus]|uniref:PAP2 superfamily protein n=1 Tax=Roseovarius pacificus TaxID=337701 RepID=A0A1M6YDT8_9RHOB|nr:phosphatase PAP2 family protein [Roseovarius pacificus]GGO50991.1 membrane protein [Roseovarius pacificus]SHL16461.1 PAP2 superfamily protein [Roseovarius pacificus]